MRSTVLTTKSKHQAGKPHRHLSLPERMRGQYWRLARRRTLLFHFCGIFCDSLVIYPQELQSTVTYLIATRRAAQKALQFYSTLSTHDMARIKPWGTISKLQDFDRQVTELLLSIANMPDQILDRVQMHLTIRDLFPKVLNTFEDLTSQLKALLEKDQERRTQAR